MLGCFVLYAQEDAVCGEEIRAVLEKEGYRCWHESAPQTLDAILDSRTKENALLGSAVVVLLWSKTAATSESIAQPLLLAQQLKKQIIAVQRDETPLPSTLNADAILIPRGPYEDNIAQLQAVLPAPDDADPLFALAERMAHPFIRERKAAIEQAVALLQQGTLSKQSQEVIKALLAYLAQHDLMDGVRTKAQEALAALAPSQASTPFSSSATFIPPVGDARHIFGVRCKNGHISYFDKRYVCKASSKVVRGRIREAGKELDQLTLTCDTCGEPITAYVDCEGYR